MAVEIDNASKGLLGAFILFIFGGGLATIAYGILLLLQHLSIQYNYGLGNLFVASIALIVIGSFLIVTVILGIYGAWKNVTAVRLSTLILIIILFLVLAITGVWTMYVVQTGRLKNTIENEIKEYSTDYKNLKAESKAKMDYMHQQYKCCVIDATAADADSIPDSCCKVAGCEDSGNGDGSKYFEKLCNDVYVTTKSSTVYRLSIITLAAGIATLLGLIFYAILYQRQAHAGYAGVSRG